MKNRVYKWQKNLFISKLDFRVRVFNILALAGVISSLLALVMTLFIDGTLEMTIVNCLIALLSAALLYYSYRTSNYQKCYIIAIIFIFFICYALLFFSGGGYRSGLPSFFIFSIVFTAFMLKNRWVLTGIIIAELLFYIGLCLYGFYWPDQVEWFVAEQDIVLDTIIGFTIVSVLLGITMHLNFRIYDLQQNELERARRDAVQANQAKSVFLASISHEFRTPINIMQGMNEMVLRERPSIAVKEFINRSQEAGQMFLALIDNILDIAKFESGQIELIEAPYNTKEIIDKLVHIGEVQAGRKKLDFIAEVADLPAVLSGDVLHFSQIVSNLLNNAVKYTEKGSVNLKIVGEKVSEKVINIIITVTDTGIGIKKENINKIFRAFMRSKRAKERNIEGFGLGLAIVKNLLDVMNGEIVVDSKYGVGSSFTVKIPQYYVDDLTVAELLQQEMPVNTQQIFIAPQARILLVDDNEGNIAVTKLFLKRTMMQIDTVKDGYACLAMVRKNDYHIILLDYMMPGLNGIETLEKIRKFNTKVPIMALTADVTGGTKEKLQRAGFIECLSKPVNSNSLEKTLRKYIPKHLITSIDIEQDSGEWTSTKLWQDFFVKYNIFPEVVKQSNNSASQYQLILQIFYENNQETIKTITVLLEKNKLEDIYHKVHSWKNILYLIGAVKLADFAQELEQKCTEKNYQYIRAAMPLFLYRVQVIFAGIAEIIKEAANKNKNINDEDGILWQQLAMHIKNYHFSESKQVLNNLIKRANGEIIPELKKILMAIDNLEFEQAEELFQDISKSEERIKSYAEKK